MINRSKVKNILVITLSNIGDVILTMPIIATLHDTFKDAKLDVMVGPRAKELFEKDRRINRLIIYDKHTSALEKKRLTYSLRKNHYDLVVDFRHTIFGWLLQPTYRTKVVFRSLGPMHRRDLHASRLKNLGVDVDYTLCPLWIDEADKDYIKRILSEHGIRKKFVVINPGARSHIKRWTEEGFSFIADKLIKDCGVDIVFVGDKEDGPVVSGIVQSVKGNFIDLSGKTTLGELAALIGMSQLVVSNDSAPMHLACALKVPVVALFGPTDPGTYGPTGENDVVINKFLPCAPCKKAQCAFNHECMKLIDKEYVFEKAKEILNNRNQQSYLADRQAEDLAAKTEHRKPNFKRILVIRTDRIGDVLLSTPVAESLRRAYPNAYIAFMTRPYAADILNGNPYIDELILYDRDNKHKNFLSTLRFALNLRKKKFDVAFILHPTNRVNWISYFAGIPERVGFNKKCGFLLTRPLVDKKVEGKKHEIEYTLDILRSYGIDAQYNGLYMPVKEESENIISSFLKEEGVGPDDVLITVHPGASCPSKIWPLDYFAKLVDMIIATFKDVKVIIISGQKEKELAKRLYSLMGQKAVLAAGRFSVSQIASLLKRSRLFISNDSGPVHISVAVGTPVIALFGRNQPGLSPVRWGPVGKNDVILHKDVGCKVCLAHDCRLGFKCLEAITPDEVFEKVKLMVDRLAIIC